MASCLATSWLACGKAEVDVHDVKERTAAGGAPASAGTTLTSTGGAGGGGGVTNTPESSTDGHDAGDSDASDASVAPTKAGDGGTSDAGAQATNAEDGGSNDAGREEGNAGDSGAKDAGKPIRDAGDSGIDQAEGGSDGGDGSLVFTCPAADGGSAEPTYVGHNDAACSTSSALACDPSTPTQLLVCESGTWTVLKTCASGEPLRHDHRKVHERRAAMRRTATLLCVLRRKRVEPMQLGPSFSNYRDVRRNVPTYGLPGSLLWRWKGRAPRRMR